MKSLHRTVDPRVSLSLGRGISVHIPKESTGSAGLRGMKFQAWLTGVGWTLNPDSQHRKLSYGSVHCTDTCMDLPNKIENTQVNVNFR